jgi:hypothetical protein
LLSKYNGLDICEKGIHFVRIQIAGEHLSFFERFGYVELQTLLTNAEVSLLQSALASSRAKQQPHEICDLAIASDEARRVICSQKLGGAAFAFVRKKPLRYGFDRLWPTFPPQDSHIDTLSPVSPTMIAVVIALETTTSTVSSAAEPFVLTSLPSEPGNALFISSKTTLRLPATNAQYLVIGYTSGKPLYCFQPQDPHTHSLKGYGYVFGDALKETTHPVVYR